MTLSERLPNRSVTGTAKHADEPDPSDLVAETDFGNRLVPCRGTAPNLTLDLNAKGQAHFFWDAREVAAEGSEFPLRGARAFSASVYTPRHSHRRASEGLYCREARGVEGTGSYPGSSLGVKLACCLVGSMPNPSSSGSLGTPRHSHRRVVEGSRLSGGKRTAEVLG